MPFTKNARPDDRLSPNGKSPDDHSVRIAKQVRDEASDVTARLIVDDESSVTQLLVGTERHIWRLYVLCSADEDGHFPDEETVRDVRTEIEAAIQDIVVAGAVE